MRRTAYGCWLSPLTRFAGPHCGGPSSEAGDEGLDLYVLRSARHVVKWDAAQIGGPDPGRPPGLRWSQRAACVRSLGRPLLARKAVLP